MNEIQTINTDLEMCSIKRMCSVIYICNHIIQIPLNIVKFVNKNLFFEYEDPIQFIVHHNIIFYPLNAVVKVQHSSDQSEFKNLHRWLKPVQSSVRS